MAVSRSTLVSARSSLTKQPADANHTRGAVGETPHCFRDTLHGPMHAPQLDQELINKTSNATRPLAPMRRRHAKPRHGFRHGDPCHAEPLGHFTHRTLQPTSIMQTWISLTKRVTPITSRDRQPPQRRRDTRQIRCSFTHSSAAISRTEAAPYRAHATTPRRLSPSAAPTQPPLLRTRLHTRSTQTLAHRRRRHPCLAS